MVPGADTDTIWPCQPNTKTGLKEKGFEFLAEMERLHIIADVSHLSDKGFWDIAEHSTRPCGQPFQLPRSGTPLPQPDR